MEKSSMSSGSSKSNMGSASAAISSSDLIDAKLEEHQLCAGSKHCPGCGHKLVKPGKIQGSTKTKLSQLRSTEEFTSIERNKNIPDVLVPWIRQILQRAGPWVRQLLHAEPDERQQRQPVVLDLLELVLLELFLVFREPERVERPAGVLPLLRVLLLALLVLHERNGQELDHQYRR
ncbi:unnamed protein product [Linum tenue]|uniref:Uncharacterized protein n=1 Tax=Linum tenue TaxID=586396 RepID=A0AAV0NPS7_9ROSI|nr:unnamed protein product [Linum tenue]